MQLHLLLIVLACGGFMLQAEAEPSRTLCPEKTQGLIALRQVYTTGQVVAPATTSTPSPTTLSIDLTHPANETWFPGGVSFTDDNGSLNLGCKNCSTSGSLTLTQTDWELLPFEQWFNQSHMLDIIEAGSVSLDIEGFVVHLELEMQPALQGSISLTLFTLPLVGFAVHSLVTGEIGIAPTLTMNWHLTSGIEMSYGFELYVYPSATLKVKPETYRLQVPALQLVMDFADPDSSTLSGLDDISVHHVPFQANVSDIDLSLSLALDPGIGLRLKLNGDDVVLDAGPRINLPSITMNIGQLATESFNAECDNISDGKAVSNIYTNDFRHLFDHLTHIDGGVELDLSLGMHGSAEILPGLSFDTAINVATRPVMTLPTQCLVFDDAVTSAAPVFTPAASVLQQIKVSVSSVSVASASAASASAAHKNAAASNRRGPAMSIMVSRSGVCGMIVMLIFVAFW